MGQIPRSTERILVQLKFQLKLCIVKFLSYIVGLFILGTRVVKNYAGSELRGWYLTAALHVHLDADDVFECA